MAWFGGARGRAVGGTWQAPTPYLPFFRTPTPYDGKAQADWQYDVASGLVVPRTQIAPISLPNSFSTTFPATENPLSQGGKFRTGLVHGLDWTDLQTTGGVAAYGTQSVHTPPPYDDSIACLDPGQFAIPVRQWAQGTIYANANTGAIEAELLLAFKITAHSADGYEIDIISADGAVVVVRWNGPISNFTPLTGEITTNVVVTVGAVWYAQIDENGVITVKCNGNTVTTVTDTTYANIAGRTPGLGSYRDTTRGAVSASNTYGLSAWSCGGF